MKRWLHKNRIFVMFFLSFVMVTAVPAGALSIVRWQSSRTIEQEVMRNNEALLLQCEQAVENVLSTVDQSLMALAFSDQVLAFVTEPHSYQASPNLGKVKGATESLTGYNHLFDFNDVLELIVYSRTSDAVVTHMASYSRADLYFHSSLIGGEEYLALLRAAPGRSMVLPAADVTLFSKPRSVIAMVRPVMKDYRASGQGNLIALIDASKFTGILSQLNLGDDGFALITDAEGAVLVQVGGAARYAHIDEIQVQDDRFVRISDLAGSKRGYVAYVPRRLALSQVTYINNMILVVAVIGVLLSLLLAASLSYRNAKPLIGIFSIAGKRGDVKPYNYDFLKGTVSSIVRENDALRERILDQAHVMRSELVRKLISGTIFDVAEIRELAEHASMNLQGTRYALLGVRNTAYGDMVTQETLIALENARALVMSALERCPAIRVYGYEGGLLETVVLIVFPQGGEAECRSALELAVQDVNAHLMEGYNLSLRYVCGGLCERLSDLPELYTSLRAAPSGATGSLVFAAPNEDGASTAPVYYPLYEETRLVKAVALGQPDAATSIVRKVIESNGPGAAQILGKCFYMTAVRICENMSGAADALSEAAFLMDCNYSEDEVADLFERMCERRMAERQDSETRVLGEILAYMKENVGNSMFSLYDVSVRFNYTEAYLYRFLRENADRSFAVSMEKLRMERACELLAGGDMSIEEIACACGYNSAHAFRRAFKKNMSMLPTEYRGTEMS